MTQTTEIENGITSVDQHINKPDTKIGMALDKEYSIDAERCEYRWGISTKDRKTEWNLQQSFYPDEWPIGVVCKYDMGSPHVETGP